MGVLKSQSTSMCNLKRVIDAKVSETRAAALAGGDSELATTMKRTGTSTWQVVFQGRCGEVYWSGCLRVGRSRQFQVVRQVDCACVGAAIPRSTAGPRVTVQYYVYITEEGAFEANRLAWTLMA